MRNGELDQVVQLVQALYSHATPPDQQSLIQQQLQQVQSSQLAWSIIPSLIQHDDSSVRFFAASTLQLKISFAWDSLPVENHESLKQSLLTWISTSASQSYPNSDLTSRAGEKVVFRKLASAITSLSLRLEIWDNWLLELIMRVSAGAGGIGTSREGVLEVLGVVIEQVSRANLVGQKRIAYMSNLNSLTPHLVSTISSSLSPTSPSSEINSALSCFTSYLLANQIPTQDLTTLYPLILIHLSNSQTSTKACSALEEVIERSSGVSSTGGIQRFVTRRKVEELITEWVVSDWVQKIVAGVVRDGDADEEAMGVMRLLCAIAEYFMGFLFDQTSSSQTGSVLKIDSPATIKFFQLLLPITFFPGHESESYNINEMTVGVWMSLQEEASDIGLVSGDGEGREGRIGREGEWAVIREIFSSLANGLRERSQWPSKGIIEDWPEDLKSSFKNYRSTTIAEILLYSYYTLREAMLSGLVELAAQQVTRSRRDNDDSFEDLEATLFCIFAIQEAVNPTTATPFLSKLFSSSILGSLPLDLSLRSTALRVIGAYSNWFALESEACISAVNFVVTALEEPTLCSEAARALTLLCDAGRKSLVSHVGSFVQVLGNMEGNVEDTEFVKVLESVSSVVQALSSDQIIEPLLTLANPIINKLQSSIDAFASLPNEARELCIQQLTYLTACAKGLSDPEGDLVDLDSSFDDSQSLIDVRSIMADERIADMRARLGLTVEGVTRIWSTDVEVVQTLSDYIKQSTSDANPSLIALDTFSLFSLATSAIQSSLSPVWLSIAASLLVRLARDQSDFQLGDADVSKIGELVERALTSVLTVFSTLSLMDENPDVVNAFLSFCISIVQHYPRIFTVLPHHLDAVITFAERGLGMQERFSLKATIDLLIQIVQQTRMASVSANIFRQTLLPHSSSILSSLILSIAGAVPRTHLTPLSELLHACILRLPEESRSGLKQLLNIPGWPNEKASNESKIKFEKAVSSARTGKQVRDAVSDFALVCRGLDGSAYGASSQSAFM